MPLCDRKTEDCSAAEQLTYRAHNHKRAGKAYAHAQSVEYRRQHLVFGGKHFGSA